MVRSACHFAAQFKIYWSGAKERLVNPTTESGIREWRGQKCPQKIKWFPMKGTCYEMS